MAIEIERKYLVKKELWMLLEKPVPFYIRQGYLHSDSMKTIRVRICDDSGFITIKGATTGISRLEYEYAIPSNEAKELLDKMTSSELSKYRYNITINEKIWEVDVFEGANEGLIIAEIELLSENETFELPEWIDIEVSHDPKYSNSSLSKTPYKNWE